MVIIIIISAFLLGFLASILSAGPVNFLILKNALIGKYKSSISMIFGASLMESIYCGFALVVTGIVLHHTKINIVSISLSTAIFLIMGIYFLVSDQSQKKFKFDIAGREIIIPFFIGFILVAMNLGIILAWSIASGTLISLGIIKITKLSHAIFFIISVFFGTIAGGSMRVFLVKKLNIKLSKKFISYIMKLSGLIFIGISIYFAYKLILLF